MWVPGPLVPLSYMPPAQREVLPRTSLVVVLHVKQVDEKRYIQTVQSVAEGISPTL